MVLERNRAVWGTTPCGDRYANGLPRGSREYFEAVAVKRYKGHPFILETMDKFDFCGKSVLEIGCGAGYDLVQLCKRGVIASAIDATPLSIELAQKNLQYHGYQGELRICSAENLPFNNDTFDYIYSCGVLHSIPNIEGCLSEINRILKPKGKAIIILYNTNSLYYWITLQLQRILQCKPMDYILSKIEVSDSTELAYVTTYTSKELRQLLNNAGLKVDNIWIRKLVKEDLPFNPLLPQKVLDWIGKKLGWYLVSVSEKS